MQYLLLHRLFLRANYWRLKPPGHSDARLPLKLEDQVATAITKRMLGAITSFEVDPNPWTAWPGP